jgi:hypothetical protein
MTSSLAPHTPRTAMLFLKGFAVRLLYGVVGFVLLAPVWWSFDTAQWQRLGYGALFYLGICTVGGLFDYWRNRPVSFRPWQAKQ